MYDYLLITEHKESFRYILQIYSIDCKYCFY